MENHKRLMFPKEKQNKKQNKKTVGVFLYSSEEKDTLKN